MAGANNKKAGNKTPARRSSKRASPRHPWLPDANDVVESKTFTSPKGRKYRILRTEETDESDAPKKRQP